MVRYSVVRPRTGALLIVILFLSMILGIFYDPGGSVRAATFTVTSAADASDQNPGDGVCLSPGGDDVLGACTLRAAIEEANAFPGTDTIGFAIGDGPQTIMLFAPLPLITEPLVIDGTTQPGAPGGPSVGPTPLIEIDGTLAGPGAHGLSISAGNTTVRGLAIGGFDGSGVYLSGAGGNVVDGSIIGLKLDGATVHGNGHGVTVDNSSNNTIGQAFFGGFSNIISGNGPSNDPGQRGWGVRLIGSGANNNLVHGNAIGLDANVSGLNSGNGGGMLILDAPNNTIGGSDYGANFISGNQGYGLRIEGPGATGNLVDGNTLGGVFGGTGGDNRLEDLIIDGAPANTISNNRIEINQIGFFSDSTMVTIRGAGAAGNMIQGNQLFGNSGAHGQGGGLTIFNAPLTQVLDNSIGNARVCLDVSGATATGTVIQGNNIGMCNMAGILLGTGGNLVGGSSPGDGNQISRSRVGISVPSDGNTIQGNRILESVWLTSNLEIVGGGTGILLSGNGNVLGGIAPGAGNVISGTFGNAVEISGDSNILQGNLIGTNISGTDAYQGGWLEQLSLTQITVTGNHGTGLMITGSDNLIGGSTGTIPGGPCAGACNVIASNGRLPNGIDAGIGIWGGTGTVIQGNHIGVDASGLVHLPNQSFGVSIRGSSDNEIGGMLPGEGNLIAGNAEAGIWIFGHRFSAPALNNTVLGNSITANGGLGIDLVAGEEGEPAVTPNDLQDGDSGPNRFQNYPVLLSATSATETGATAIGGFLNSAPLTTFRIEFFLNDSCDPAGHGEGQYFLGTRSVVTDLSGNIFFIHQLASTLPGQSFVTATATDPDGNTSEFSNCQEVVGPVGLLEGLIVDVGELRESGIINGGQESALTVKLEGAIRKFEESQFEAATNKLGAFNNQVNAFVNAGMLSVGQGDELTLASNTVIAVLDVVATPVE